MHKRISIRIEEFFGPMFYISLGFLAIGLYTLYSDHYAFPTTYPNGTYLFCVTCFFCFWFMTQHKGIEINPKERKLKIYTSTFFIKVGEWQSFKEYDEILLTTGSAIAGRYSYKVYKLFLVSKLQPNQTKNQLGQFVDLKLMESVAGKISIATGFEIVRNYR